MIERHSKEKKRILLMDDEEEIQALVEEVLQNIGYEVEIAKDGEEAIERYQVAKRSQRTFDAVILDLNIQGGMGGEEVMKKLLEIDPNVKAIVCSGYSNDPIISDFKRYGFLGSLSKPYKIEKLHETLSGMISKEYRKKGLSRNDPFESSDQWIEG